jgi:hypothetical protein
MFKNLMYFLLGLFTGIAILSNCNFMSVAKADSYSYYEQESLRQLEQTNDTLKQILEQTARIKDKIH